MVIDIVCLISLKITEKLNGIGKFRCQMSSAAASTALMIAFYNFQNCISSEISNEQAKK